MKKLLKKLLDLLISKISKELGIEQADIQNQSSSDDLFNHSDSGNSGTTGDEVDFSKLKWVYGGEDGSKAIESTGVQIKNLRVNVGSRISYSWARTKFKRTLKEWGLEDSDASAFAIFGYLYGDSYKCGKMDWISTSRTFRSWENIKDGYKGWNDKECSASNDFIFLILSKDRKKRSNVIRYKKG
jgi:hypothetical protein